MVLALRTLPVALAGAAALLGLVAVVDPVLALAAAFGIAFVLLMLADLAVGVALFAFAASFFEAVPALGDISVAKGLGAVLVLSWFAALSLRPSWREQLFSALPGYTTLLVLLVAWGVVSVLWSGEPATTLSTAQRLALNVLLVPIAFAAIRTPRQFRWFAAAFIVGVLGSSLYGLVLAPADFDSEARLAGAGIDPNYLSLWLVAAGTLAVGLAARRDTPPPQRALIAMAAVACFLLVIFTGSRTGLIATGVLLVCAPAVLGRGRRLPAFVAAVASAAALVGAFFAFAPATVIERVTHPEGGSGRTDIWTVGWRMVEDRPVAGVGLGAFKDETVHYLLAPGAIKRSDYIVDHPRVAHNLYLEVLAEVGVVGLALYLAIAFGSVLLGLGAAREFDRTGRRAEGMLARAVVLALLAVLAGSFFVSVEYTKPFWIVVALGPILLALSRRPAPAERRAW